MSGRSSSGVVAAQGWARPELPTKAAHTGRAGRPARRARCVARRVVGAGRQVLPAGGTSGRQAQTPHQVKRNALVALLLPGPLALRSPALYRAWNCACARPCSAGQVCAHDEAVVAVDQVPPPRQLASVHATWLDDQHTAVYAYIPVLGLVPTVGSSSTGPYGSIAGADDMRYGVLFGQASVRGGEL